MKIELSLPRSVQRFRFSGPGGPGLCIHSETTTQDSVPLRCVQPKFPSRAPRSGTAIRSVSRRIRRESGSTSAAKSGARCRNTWPLFSARRV